MGRLEMGHPKRQYEQRNHRTTTIITPTATQVT